MSPVGGEPDYETRRVETAGVSLAVDIFPIAGSPQAPGFVLVHGLASNARLYDGVAGFLAAAGHGAASLDLRGHGRSDKPDGGYDYDTMCGDLSAVLAFLRADAGPQQFVKPVLVGQSYGANLVLEYAARRPDDLAGVCCIDGGTIDLRGRFETVEAAIAQLTPPHLEGTPHEELARRFRETHPDWPAAGIEASLANFELRPDGTVAPHLSLEHHLAIVRAMWERRPSDLYPLITTPVLLMPADSPGAAQEWSIAKRKGIVEALASLPKAEVRWFSPADHDIHAQYPRQVAEALLEAAPRLFA